MVCKIGLCLVAVLALASLGEAQIQQMRQRYTPVYAGGSVSPRAHASAGPDGVRSSVSFPYRAPRPAYYHVESPSYKRSPVFKGPSRRQYPRAQPAYYDQAPMEETTQYDPYDEEATASNYYTPPPPPSPRYRAPAPVRTAPRPYRNRYNPSYQRHPQPFVGRPRYQQPAATSSATASVTSNNGGRSSMATASAGSNRVRASRFQAPSREHSVQDKEEQHEQYDEPETVEHVEARSGTFGDNANEHFEEGSYVRDTESQENHEDGREDGDHYLNQHSYGKAKDVNHKVGYTNDNEDIHHDEKLYRKKKSNINFFSDFNKQHRETGSGMTAHDKFSAQFNKDSKKLKEKVDQRYSKQGDGFMETKNFNTNRDEDEEDEMEMDTRGLGNFVGADGKHHPQRPSFVNPAPAATASASASISKH